ncbi:MAG: glycosyltransferase family 4 protein [Rhodothermales bacterium]|nr:glycosyltransferase family 4 protein [Rhodothermales bacterium]
MAVKTVHLATTHRASDPRIFQKECRTLAAAGYEVVFVVPHARDEVVDGVQVRAVSAPTGGRERMTTTVWQVYRRALEEGPDAVCHIHDSDLLVAGLLLKRQGRHVVYDMHEDTPRQMLYQHWIPRPLRRAVGFGYRLLELWAARVFDGLVAAEPVIVEQFPGHDVALVRNFPLLEEFSDEGAVPYAERPPSVAYVGALTEARGIKEVVTAVGLLAEDTEVQLEVGGSFHPERLRGEVEAMPGWQRVTYHGYLSRPGVNRLLNRVRVGVVTFHPTERYLGNYPTKLFEYMAAGLPVVVSDFAQLRPFVEGSDCALLVDPLDPAAIAEAVRWLLDHPDEAEAMGQRGRRAVEAHYNWAGEAERLLRFYADLTGGPEAP